MVVCGCRCVMRLLVLCVCLLCVTAVGDGVPCLLVVGIRCCLLAMLFVVVVGVFVRCRCWLVLRSAVAVVWRCLLLVVVAVVVMLCCLLM